MFNSTPHSFRFAHVGVAVALAVAAGTSIGLVREAGAAGNGTASSFVPIVPCRLADTRVGSDHVGTRTTPISAGNVRYTAFSLSASSPSKSPMMLTPISSHLTPAGTRKSP